MDYDRPAKRADVPELPKRGHGQSRPGPQVLRQPPIARGDVSELPPWRIVKRG